MTHARKKPTRSPFFWIIIMAIAGMIALTFFVLMEQTNAQEQSGFDRLMSGETVTLDWGDQPIEWGNNPLLQPMPQAGELLREFTLAFLQEQDQESAWYIFGQILLYTAPETTFNDGFAPIKGLAATTARWDETTHMLYLQASRFLPADPPGTPPGGRHIWGCGGGLGAEPYILWTEIEPCVSYDEQVGGVQIMPTITIYRDIFSVVYIAPDMIP